MEFKKEMNLEIMMIQIAPLRNQTRVPIMVTTTVTLEMINFEEIGIILNQEGMMMEIEIIGTIEIIQTIEIIEIDITIADNIDTDLEILKLFKFFRVIREIRG